MPDNTSSAPLVEPDPRLFGGADGPVVAMVRGVPDSFADALTTHASGGLDVGTARAQHAAYVRALAELVDRVVHVPPDARFPDCCFIEDTVVVAQGRALLTRPGAPSRRGEIDAVAAALPAGLLVLYTPEHARIDGGDVLRVGDTFVVGRSSRTDEAGIRVLRRAFEPVGMSVVDVAIEGALHLKCGCTAARSDLVVLAQGFVDPAVFDDIAEVAMVPATEQYGANMVAVGSRALVAEGHPHVERALKERGLDPIPLNVRELAKADGSLTCLSVLIAAPEG